MSSFDGEIRGRLGKRVKKKAGLAYLLRLAVVVLVPGAEMHSKLKSKLNRPDLPQARSCLDLLTPRQKECAMRVEIPIQMSSISTRMGNKPASERALSGTDWKGRVFGLKKRTAGVCARKEK